MSQLRDTAESRFFSPADGSEPSRISPETPRMGFLFEKLVSGRRRRNVWGLLSQCTNTCRHYFVSCRPRVNIAIDGLGKLILRELKVIVRLQVDPELGRGPEVTSEAKRGVRTNRAAAVDDR